MTARTDGRLHSRKTYFGKVDVRQAKTECWDWKASTFPNGYGQFTIDGKPTQAHRFAWWHLRGGGLHPHEQVCHRCDNRKCCNPHHLFLGAAVDNVRDCIEKGRRASPRRGVKSNLAKLNDDQVKEIRRLFDTHTKTKSAIARQFSVSPGTVGLIVRRMTWPHL